MYSSPHLKGETEPVSEVMCLIDFRVPDDGQTPETGGSACYKPSRELYRIY
jgi:hypothetical protein